MPEGFGATAGGNASALGFGATGGGILVTLLLLLLFKEELKEVGPMDDVMDVDMRELLILLRLKLMRGSESWRDCEKAFRRSSKRSFELETEADDLSFESVAGDKMGLADTGSGILLKEPEI